MPGSVCARTRFNRWRVNDSMWSTSQSPWYAVSIQQVLNTAVIFKIIFNPHKNPIIYVLPCLVLHMQNLRLPPLVVLELEFKPIPAWLLHRRHFSPRGFPKCCPSTSSITQKITRNAHFQPYPKQSIKKLWGCGQQTTDKPSRWFPRTIVGEPVAPPHCAPLEQSPEKV